MELKTTQNRDPTLDRAGNSVSRRAPARSRNRPHPMPPPARHCTRSRQELAQNVRLGCSDGAPDTISLVRSVTLTSITFMITMPPPRPKSS